MVKEKMKQEGKKEHYILQKIVLKTFVDGSLTVSALLTSESPIPAIDTSIS